MRPTLAILSSVDASTMHGPALEAERIALGAALVGAAPTLTRDDFTAPRSYLASLLHGFTDYEMSARAIYAGLQHELALALAAYCGATEAEVSRALRRVWLASRRRAVVARLTEVESEVTVLLRELRGVDNGLHEMSKGGRQTGGSGDGSTAVGGHVGVPVQLRPASGVHEKVSPVQQEACVPRVHERPTEAPPSGPRVVQAVRRATAPRREAALP